MAGVRVTVGHRSRIPGTQIGVQLNVFRLNRLQAGINGDALMEILMDIARPSLEQAVIQWPVWTGASRDSISLDPIEIGPTLARVVLQAGGEKLISDPRNESHKDYAPFIEFNGTKTAPPGILFDAVYGRDTELRQDIHSRVSDLVRSLIA